MKNYDTLLGPKISAQVRADQLDAQPARYFHATVASFDPFVTGKPLTLNLELIVIDASPTDHRIFAAVSPKPGDAPVWKLLRTLKEQFKERLRPDPEVNRMLESPEWRPPNGAYALR